MGAWDPDEMVVVSGQASVTKDYRTYFQLPFYDFEDNIDYCMQFKYGWTSKACDCSNTISID